MMEDAKTKDKSVSVTVKVNQKSGTKDADKVNEPAPKKSKVDRLRKQPDWFGNREADKNDDDLFDAAQNTSKSAENTLIDECRGVNSESLSSASSTAANTTDLEDTQLDLFSPGEKILFKELMKLKKEMTVLQRAIVGVEVKLEERVAPKPEMIDFQKVSDDELAALHLPVSNKDVLIELNDKLKEKDFFMQAVRINTTENI